MERKRLPDRLGLRKRLSFLVRDREPRSVVGVQVVHKVGISVFLELSLLAIPDEAFEVPNACSGRRRVPSLRLTVQKPRSFRDLLFRTLIPLVASPDFVEELFGRRRVVEASWRAGCESWYGILE